jgi:hypothetical protein
MCYDHIVQNFSVYKFHFDFARYAAYSTESSHDFSEYFVTKFEDISVHESKAYGVLFEVKKKKVMAKHVEVLNCKLLWK